MPAGGMVFTHQIPNMTEFSSKNQPDCQQPRQLNRLGAGMQILSGFDEPGVLISTSLKQILRS